jgi:hypothetical protein
MSEPDYQAALDANPEVGAKIDEFLAHPETGIRRERPANRVAAATWAEITPGSEQADEYRVAWHAQDLSQLLADQRDWHTEEIAALDTGTIVNVTRADGEYLYTLTISRTPGC